MTAAIEITGLRKTFGRTVALDGLDLEVRTGEVHGFLGPNGSGKSTTIRVLLGLLRADAGEVRLLGGDPWRDASSLHRRLAYVPGDVDLWPTLTGGEVIDLLGRLRGGRRPAPPRGPARALRPRPDPKRSRSYSKGNRQKVALVAALASDVELLLLDEPTSGLDPLMEAVFTECVREEAARRPHGAAVEPHPGRGRGALRPGQHPARRPDRAARHAGRAASPDAHDGGGRDPRAARRPGRRTGGGARGATDGRVRFDVDTDHLDEAMSYLASLQIRSLVSHPPTLEELFLRQYGDTVEAEASP